MRIPSDFEVLRLRDFRLVFGASVVSLLGDAVVPVALAFAVLDLTGSAADLGIVLAAQTVALVACLLLGGVVADRVSRRLVMVAADLIRLIGQGVLGVLLLTGNASVAEIAISQALLGGASGFFNPASSGLLPAVAGGAEARAQAETGAQTGAGARAQAGAPAEAGARPGANLRQANALRGIASASTAIVGPAIAGALVLITGPGAALLIDAASYGVSALLLTQVRADTRPGTATSAPRHFFGDLREGFHEVRSRAWLQSSLLTLSVLVAFTAALPVLGPLVAKRHLGGAGAWAAILAARATGGLIGGAAVLRLAPRRPLLTAVLACTTTPAITILLGIPASLAVLVPISVLAGVGPMVFNTLWETTLQQHIPAEALSRVSSYDWFVSLAFQPVGLALVGPLASAIGTAPALYLCGGVELALTVSLLAVREIRTLTSLS